MSNSRAYKLNSRCNQLVIVFAVVCLILYTWHLPILAIINVSIIIFLITLTAYLLYWPVAIIYSLSRTILKKLTIIKACSLSDIDSLDWSEFERYVAERLTFQGYENVRITEKYDLGIDIVAIKNDCRLGVQVKHYKSLVGIEAVREAVAGLNAYKCNQSMVVTNSYFSRPAKKLAKCNNCILVDRNVLKSWLKLKR